MENNLIEKRLEKIENLLIGQMIGDRLKTMFNFIELPGNSRRE